jgi:formylglycine-generating enzyme required for sulfatase activity/FKBP-type peptidyl-prolyl cis-trans isomerase
MLVLSLFALLALQPEICHAEQYLFLVGVKDYSQKGELTDLKYAEEDVHTLAQMFSDAGVPSTNIVLMTQRVAANKARFAPSSEQIRNELDLLLNLLNPDDSIIVGFSGHGLQFKNDETNYYCPIDAKPDTNHKDTLVSLTEVYRKLDNCKAKTKLLLVDACRNDPLSSTAKAARRIEIEPVFSRPAPVFDGGTIAIFSCSESEQSFEHPDLKSGLFFHFVNRALAGEADTDDDNIVDLGELENFAIKNVQKWAQAKLGKKQTPESRGTKRGTIQLVRFDRKVVPKFPPIETMTEMDRNSPSIPLPKIKATGKTITNSLGMKLTLIPKGTFLMGAPPDEEGSDDSERQHVVTISKDFYLGMYEVTQAEYQKIMRNNPSEFQGDKIVERHPKTGRVVKTVDSSNYPVENVSWDDAVDFCYLLSNLPDERAAGRVYRLPTEAEWEHACRAGTLTAFSFGNDKKQLSEYAWFSGSGSTTHPVVEKRPNPWGLYDMLGNVNEWCSDHFDDYPTSAAVDPAGPSTGAFRVYRGGSYGSDATDCRSAARNKSIFGKTSNATGDRIGGLGFRVALSFSENPKSPEAGNRASDLIGSSIVSPVLMESNPNKSQLAKDFDRDFIAGSRWFTADLRFSLDVDFRGADHEEASVTFREVGSELEPRKILGVIADGSFQWKSSAPDFDEYKLSSLGKRIGLQTNNGIVWYGIEDGCPILTLNIFSEQDPFHRQSLDQILFYSEKDMSDISRKNSAKMAALPNNPNPLFQKIFGDNRVNSLPSGVVFSDLVEGNSRVIAGRKSIVTVEYKCYFASNMQQIPPESLGAVRFTLAVEDVRPIGVQDGLIGIGVGGTRRVFVPSKIAFGSNGSKDVRGGRLVPPNTDLVWDLDVVHIKNPMP